MAIGWGVPGDESRQEPFDGVHQSSRPVVLSRDVHGAVPVTFPKRRSQVANGTFESCCRHRFFTDASISSIRVELSFSEADKEAFGQEELLVSGNVMEAGVKSSGILEEASPSVPHSLDAAMSFFLFRVQDDSMICIVAQTNEEMSGGRFDISKLAGTSCGYWDKTRWVRMLLGGRSTVNELVFPLSSPSKDRRSATSLKAPSRC